MTCITAFLEREEAHETVVNSRLELWRCEAQERRRRASGTPAPHTVEARLGWPTIDYRFGPCEYEPRFATA